MNWSIFFSSLSTASGVIVGIFAAFLITKIVNDQARFNQNKAKLCELINTSNSLKNEAENRYFSWYNKRTKERALDDIEEHYHDKHKILEAEEYYNNFMFSPFQSKKDALKAIEIKRNEFIQIEKEERQKLGPSMSLVTPPNIHVTRMRLNEEMTEEREFIDRLLVKVRLQTNINRDLLSTFNNEKESSKLVAYSIGASLLLFYAGVIYPISFLPLAPGTKIILSVRAFWDILFSLKGVLISLVSLIFTGLMATFFIVNHRLKHDRSKITSLRDLCHIKNYSQYFENYEINKNGT